MDLVATLLSASISSPSSQDAASPPGLAGEMLRVMKEAGVLKGLTNALKLVDNNHPQVVHADKHCIYGAIAFASVATVHLNCTQLATSICSRANATKAQRPKLPQRRWANGA